MEALFLKLMNLSINAGWLVLVVLLARVVFRRCPKWVFCLLWGIVALRLLCPFAPESSFSLLPSGEPLPKDIIFTAQPQIQSGITSIDNAINPLLSDVLATPNHEVVSVNRTQLWSFLLACVWAMGAGLMLVYGCVSTVMLRHRLATATLLEKGIKQSEWIASPIVFGFFRPTIYLPYHLDEGDAIYVIAHEKAHIQRKDHLWKALGFLLLSVYWFHPLMWCAYLLFCKDVEGACDEKVVHDMEKAEKRAYSMALLNCSTNRRQKLAYPLAFGEISVKERVSNVMNYKKPAFWVVVVAIVGCVALAVGFLTSPKGHSDTTGYSTFTTGNMLSITLPKELSLIPNNEYQDEPTRERFYLEEPQPIKEKQFALSEWAWFSAGWVDVVRKDSDWMGMTDNGEPVLNGQNHCEYSSYRKTDYGWMCSFDCDLYTNDTVQNVEQERSFWCYVVDGEEVQCWLFLAKDTYDQSFGSKIAKTIHLEKAENPSLDEGEAQVPAKFRAEEALFSFFAGFSEGDYSSMRDYCTADFQQLYFHEEDVFGMKTAIIQEMVGEGLSDGSFRYMLDVSMEPSEMSAFYPETSTTFYVHVEKVNDKWLIDGLSTDGFFESVDDSNAVWTDKDSFDAMTKDELIPYFQTAEKAVEAYYKTRMELTGSQPRKLIEQTKQANPNASDYEVIKAIALSGMSEFLLDSAVKDYLGGKFAYEALPALEDDYETIYQGGTYSVEDWKVLDDMLICSVTATESFRYSDSEQNSLLGELIQVVIRNPQNPQIIDWYEDDKGNFDSMVRGNHLDLSKSRNMLVNMSSDTLNQKIFSCFANSVAVLLTEGKAAYQASLKARAYIEFHKDEYPDADYDEIEPIVTAELTDVEEFDTRAYKVNVEFPVPESTNSPAFEILIDANSGDTLKTTPLTAE